MRFLATLVCTLAIAWPQLVAAQSPAHPLAGRIFDTRTGALTDIADPALIPKLFPCGAITLLGEVHDNGEHHAMRGRLIREAMAANRAANVGCGRGGLVFEHISATQRDNLKRFYEFERLARRPANTWDFFRILEWRKSAWPDSRLFRPLFQEAIRSKRQIYAGHPDNHWVKQIAREGLAALPPERSAQLRLNEPLPSDLRGALNQELQDSHCGMKMPENMLFAQRYRDAYMAEQTAKAAAEQGSAILFAGNGHVRADRGVPYDLRRIAPDRTVITVAFVETEDGKSDAAAYGPKYPDGKPATDFVAFALPATREDPCEQMRKHMKR